MKKIMLLSVLVMSLFAFNQASAQVHVSVNIGLQPIWGPVGYDHVDYYYLPDIDGYYDVGGHVFVYFDNGVWVRRAELPERFRNIDLYHTYKVVVNEHEPWLHHEVIRNRYVSYRGRHDQPVIRDSHEQKYWENHDHPMHNQWHGEEHHGEQHHEQRHEEHRDEHHEHH